MVLPHATAADDFAPLRALSGVYPENIRTDASAVSWGAIVAGGVATAALSLILLMLGTGLGLSSVSPWAHNGVSAATFGVSTILWVTLPQLVACAMGGYLAGRLRTKWVAVHTDEVYFRDTAHGFLAWAVASLATAALLTSVSVQAKLRDAEAAASAVAEKARKASAYAALWLFISLLIGAFVASLAATYGRRQRDI